MSMEFQIIADNGRGRGLTDFLLIGLEREGDQFFLCFVAGDKDKAGRRAIGAGRGPFHQIGQFA